MKTAKNQWDKVSANFQTKTFIPDPILSKEAIIAESEQRRQQRKEFPVATEVKPTPNEAKLPVATNVKPVKAAAAAAAGGGRKKRKKKTKKRNQKKRTRRKSRRRK